MSECFVSDAVIVPERKDEKIKDSKVRCETCADTGILLHPNKVQYNPDLKRMLPVADLCPNPQCESRKHLEKLRGRLGSAVCNMYGGLPDGVVYSVASEREKFLQALDEFIDAKIDRALRRR